MNDKTMPPETLAALRESIEHWDRLASGNRKPGEEVGPEHCALCKMFLHPKNGTESCAGCPVFNRTNMRRCVGTPYQEASDAAENDSEDDNYETEDFLYHANEELEFLRSLVPKEEI